jgi:hypothetical protein
MTYDDGADGHVAAVKHPESPGGEPAVAFLGGKREDFLFEESAEDGTVVAFVNAGDGDGELEILDLVEADVDGIREVVSQEEDCGRVFCVEVLVATSRLLWSRGNKPKRRLLISAYAFFSAAVRHFGSSKLLARKRSVAPCSRFQVAMRHSP